MFTGLRRGGKHVLRSTRGGVLMVIGRSDEIRIGQLAIRFLLEGEASGGSVAVFEFDVPAAARVPIAHSHDGYEETIYGLEGVLTWTLDGRQTDVGPGEVLCIPRGVVHRFDNDHGVDATMLAIVSPGILGPAFSLFTENPRRLILGSPDSDKRASREPIFIHSHIGIRYRGVGKRA